MKSIVGLSIFFFAWVADAACTSPAGVAGQLTYSTPLLKFCDGTNWWDTSVTTDATCTAGEARSIKYSSGNLLYCNGTNWIGTKGGLRTSCSGTTAGTFRYNSTDSVYEFCDGTNWYNMYPNYGFFVRTTGTYNGNLGGLAGANAKCLTNLTANNWLGKTLAVANGKLVSATVRALLCDGTTCQNPIANTSYHFAIAGAVGSGGSMFTSTATGQGPSNNANWSGSTYMGSSLTWSGRAAGTTTLWPTTTDGNHCTSWSTTGSNGTFGDSNATDSKRWKNNTTACTSTAYLICMVDP